jgi:hypothetical protein
VLKGDFKDFLTDASGEEIHFLHEVLSYRFSNHTCDPIEVEIASAFEAYLSDRHNAGYLYIDDPALFEAVKEFIKKYKESDGRLPPSGGWCLWRAPADDRRNTASATIPHQGKVPPDAAS